MKKVELRTVFYHMSILDRIASVFNLNSLVFITSFLTFYNFILEIYFPWVHRVLSDL